MDCGSPLSQGRLPSISKIYVRARCRVSKQFQKFISQDAQGGAIFSIVRGYGEIRGKCRNRRRLYLENGGVTIVGDARAFLG